MPPGYVGRSTREPRGPTSQSSTGRDGSPDPPTRPTSSTTRIRGVEHDPVEIWENALATMRRALDAVGIEAGDLAAIGIANQRETAVCWEAETGEPVGNAIVWQDRRTTSRVEELIEDGREPEIREITGLPLDAYFSATKLEWLLSEWGLRDRAEAGSVGPGRSTRG